MNYIKHMNKAMELFAQDERLLPSHISLYLALFQAWNQNRFRSQFTIDRNELMQASKIGSFTTFTRIIKDLKKWGYINYLPSFSASRGSTVELYSFCTAEGTEEEQNCTGGSTIEPQNCTGESTDTLQNCNAGCTAHEQNCTGEEQNCTATYAKTVQPLYININKQNKHYKQEETAHAREKNDVEKKMMAEEVATPKKKKAQAQNPEFVDVLEYFTEQKFPQSEAEKFFNHYEANGWLIGGKSPMVDWRAAARNWMLKVETFEKPKHTHPQPRAGNLHTANLKDYSEPL